MSNEDLFDFCNTNSKMAREKLFKIKSESATRSFDRGFNLGWAQAMEAVLKKIGSPPPAEKPGDCPNCGGSGQKLNGVFYDCPTCRGTGDLTPQGAWSTECDDCGGYGEAKKPDSVTDCKYWVAETYDCTHPATGPIYCGKYNYSIPEDCPLKSNQGAERW